MLFAVQLAADNDTLNHHRVYRMEVALDLLGDVLVTISHGRSGRLLSARTIPVENVEAAQSLVRAKLRRRASAPRRIGCSYRITDLAAVDDPAPWFLDAAAQRRLANT